MFQPYDIIQCPLFHVRYVIVGDAPYYAGYNKFHIVMPFNDDGPYGDGQEMDTQDYEKVGHYVSDR